MIRDRLRVLRFVELELALLDTSCGPLHAVGDLKREIAPPPALLHHHLHDAMGVAAFTHQQNLGS